MPQKLGQHFLTNAEVLHKVAAVLEIKPDEVIVEIGPGHGELTQYLLKEIEHSGPSDTARKKLIVIEKDEELAAQLPDAFGDSLEVRQGDVLKLLPEIAAVLSKQGASYKLVGNIPYYLTGFLFRLIAGLEHKPVRMVFTMQKEVAERLTEKAPRMNRLAAAIQWWAEPRMIGVISRQDFDPAPDVDSATVLLETKQPGPGPKESERYYQMLQALFQQPRKTILNNLASATKLSREELVVCLKKARIDPANRPQDLNIDKIAGIADTFSPIDMLPRTGKSFE
jgi:16S rRNA (adenine1518-N6/adenine1519-N6)-dimethyltransferase